MSYASNKTGTYEAVNTVSALYDHPQKNDFNKTVKDYYVVCSFPFGEDKTFCLARHIECKN
ncbi:hypothetical protein [Bartonella vinsonii]|uniref:hypothetical protein n=1 Tax=Bartonella vinsonii TaxID=33047 RepID=UPI0003A8397A|nr:hypothetical protein [Bartonella vinsonii]